MDDRPSIVPPDTHALPRAGKRRRLWPWIAAVVIVAALLWSLLGRQPQTGAGMPGPPGARGDATQSVGVASVTRGDVPIVLTALGTVTSLATVTVKSQISGYLTEVHFSEGQMVKKGDVLAQIDPRTYDAALAQYRGQLEKDQALLDNARIDLDRYQHLIKQDSTSKQTVDTAAATVRQYEGTVRSDQAQVDAQLLNLAYCRIVSPVDGRVGLRLVDAGNYVTASDSTGLVIVTRIDPISVLFTLPEDNIGSVMARLKSGARLSVEAYDRTNARKLADGILQTLDNQIDTTTGTVKLRATFANTDGALFPNQFVTTRLLVDTVQNALLVPSAAVQTGTPGTFVYVVGDGNKVSVRKIVPGASANGVVVATSGLADGDRVVVDGVDRLRDGATVTIPAEGGAGGRPRQK